MPQTRTLYRRTGPHPKRLTPLTEPIALTHATDVLIKVHAVSLNYRDINILRGTNPWGVKDDGIPASDAAGEVVGVGEEVEGFEVGDRVTPVFDQVNMTGEEDGREWLGGETDGVLSTHLLFHYSKLVKIPTYLSYEEASLLPCAALTAYSALNSPTSLAGTTILLQGTGGVSLFSAVLAHAAGAKLFITSSSNAKLAALSTRFPDLKFHGINYIETPNWEDDVLKRTGGRGADLVVENGGASTLARSIKAARRGGTVSCVGYLGGEKGETQLSEVVSLLIERRVTLRGINVGSKLQLTQLYRLLENTKLSLSGLIDKEFPFSRAEEAFGYLAAGEHLGKVVIKLAENH